MTKRAKPVRELETTTKTPPAHPDLFQNAMASLLMLRVLAAEGDIMAARAIRDIGLQAAGFLEGLVLAETSEKNPRGGVVRKIARESLNWPHRLSAIESIRSGPSVGNAEKYAKFLTLGSETDFALDDGGRGRKRDFQGQSGFALKVFQRMQKDLRTYGGRSDDDLRTARYYAWSYKAVPGNAFDEVMEVPKPAALHDLFVAYVKALRNAPADDLGAWVEAAVLWAKVETENEIEKLGVWPDRVYLDATGVAGGVEAQLRKRFRASFRSVVKRFGLQ